MDYTFVFGIIPKAVVDEEVELTRNGVKGVQLNK